MATVLIIEDDELLRDVLAKALELTGYKVLQACNGLEGLSLFDGSPVDLVITDIVMPIQEGVETIFELRRRAPSVPIIAMSGGVANSKLYLTIAGRIGAKRIIAKPFTPQELLQLVAEVLKSPDPRVG